MKYKGVEVEYICLNVYLKEKASEDWKVNEKYVLNKMVKLGLNDFSVENPIDDMVCIYLQDQEEELDLNKLTYAYKLAGKEFEEVKINLYLDDCIESEGNSIDLNLEEFLKLYKED